MNTHPRRHKTSWTALTGIVALLIAIAAYMNYGLKQAALFYDSVQTELSRSVYSGNLGSFIFNDEQDPLYIPSFSLFASGGIWSLVSAKVPLETSFIPSNLVATQLAHGDSDQPMQVQSTIEAPLERLFADAQSAGYPLMISSAYRSIDEQQKLLDAFILSKGEAAAALYVAQPGTSEHHTGLAVDISDVTSACGLDSDSCGLSDDTAQWLEDNAYKYGFIQRYPEGEQPTTGIAYEPWHYRYVGVPLATHLHTSGLLLDTVLTQMRPAFSTVSD